MQDMDAVYRQHFRMVYQYLMSLTHQPDVAEELAQETFCQTVRKPGIPPDRAAQQCSGCGNYRDDSKRKTKYY